MQYFFMKRNYPGYFFTGPFLLHHQKCLDTSQGVFRKEETKGYVNEHKKPHKIHIYIIEPSSPRV